MSSSPSEIKVQLVLPQEKVALKEKAKGIGQLLIADRPVGIYLLMWPALWALWIAGEGDPDWYITVVFVIVTLVLYSAGSAMNCYADRRIDVRFIRACQRPISMGIVKPQEALIVFGVLSVVAFSLILTLNLSTILMSFVVLVMAAVYPFVKRYTHFPQMFLGATFGWTIPMAFTAIQDSVSLVTWVLFSLTLMWAMIYDTQYAIVHREEDMKVGVKSTAILFGRFDQLIIGLLQIMMLACLLWVGDLTGRSGFYFYSILLTSIFFIRQQILLRRHGREGAYTAFLNNNHFGMTIFLILVIDYTITI